MSILHGVGNTYDLGDNSVLTWMIAGYTLTVGTFIIIAGRLGDIFGYKQVFLSGFVWSAIWTAAAGVAVFSTETMFAVCRVFQGVGAAMCLPNAIALLGIAYSPGKKKSMAFALVAAAAPAGSILGAAGGGLLALTWWPIAYWAFASVLGAIAVIGYFSIPVVETGSGRPESFEAAVKELDIPGMVTGVTALLLISFAFNQAPISGWGAPHIWLALIVGTVLVFSFIVIEWYYAPSPILPLKALSTNVSFVLGAVACGWACFGIWSFYSWQFLQVIRGLSPLMATAWFSPVGLVGILASATTGQMLHRLGPRVVLAISLAAFLIGTALIATCPRDQIYWAQTFICMLVIPWGMEMSFPAATMLLSNSASRRRQGIAASLVSAVVYYGISVGIGLGATVEKQVLSDAGTKDAILNGYRAALWLGVGVAGLGVIICLAFLQNERRRASLVPQPEECESRHRHSQWYLWGQRKPPMFCVGSA